MIRAALALSAALTAQTLPAQSVGIAPAAPPAMTIPSEAIDVSRPPESNLPKLPEGLLSRLGSRLRLQPCDYDKSRFAGKAIAAIRYLEDPDGSCTEWSAHPHPAARIFAGKVRVGKEDLLAVVYASKQTVESGHFPALVLDVVGGPGGQISPGLNDGVQLALARRGAVVIRIGYAGTLHNSHYPDPDLDRATSQVRDYAGMLRESNPDSKLILLGESLGGYIVANAMHNRSAAIADGAVLAIPLIYSPSEAVANSSNILQTRTGSDGLIRQRPSVTGKGEGTRIFSYSLVDSLKLSKAFSLMNAVTSD